MVGAPTFAPLSSRALDPEETDDRTASGSFLPTGPMAGVEQHGSTRTRTV